MSSTAQTGAASAHNAKGSFKFDGFTVPAILSWKNPQVTGVALGQALGAWVVLSSTLTLRLFLRLAFWVVGIASLVEFVTRRLNGPRNGLVSSYRPSRFLPIAEADINALSANVAGLIRTVLYGVEHVVDAQSPETGLQVAGAAWFLYTLIGFFSLRALALAAIVLTFALPALYLQFKPEVDAQIREAGNLVHEQLDTVHKAAYAKAGPQIDFARNLFGARGGFPANTTPSVPTREVPGPAAHSTGVSSGVSTGASAPSNPYATGVPTGTSHTTNTVPLTNLPETIKQTTAGGHSTADPAAGVPLTSHSANVPQEVFSQFDSVPTLAGNIKIDQETVNKFASDAADLRSSIAQDKQGL